MMYCVCLQVSPSRQEEQARGPNRWRDIKMLLPVSTAEAAEGEVGVM